MLSANFVDGIAGVTGSAYPRLAWYRILTVDDGPIRDTSFTGTGTRWYRNINVTGSDWPTMIYQDPQTLATSQLWNGADIQAPAGLSSPVAFCTLMDDAVAQYGPIPIT